ncbi:MAG TPA: glycosyltransferase, partial [Fimbriimonadaceae bacterium]|nr:glycosyltransferase [Fimbriimonadaceae bacterium]
SIACFTTACNRSGRLNKLYHDIAQWAYRWRRIASRFSHVIFISRLNQRVLEPYLNPGVRRSLVSNPSDFSGPAPAVIAPDSPFLFVGSLDQHKDPVTAARAARIAGAPIVFVGAGSTEREVRRENPDALITGWVGREEVEARLRSSRALVFPSRWYEAQPLTPIEAAACGLPLLVSDASSAVELVEALGVGEIFPAGDAEALAGHMRRYLDLEFARAQSAATAAAFAKQDFSMDLHVRRLLEIYESELADPRFFFLPI